MTARVERAASLACSKSASRYPRRSRLGIRKYGRTLTAHLDSLGLIGPHFSAAHAIWVDDDDLRRLAGGGGSVVHNPLSNMRFGSGLARLRPMIEGGISVGIGTDGVNSSDSLNMFEATRLASLISRIQSPDYNTWLASEEVLQMATAGSARALGFGDSIGRLSPGAKADIVFLDATHIHYVPLGDIVRQIVFTESGAAVDSVMIGGRMILDHGRLTTFDETKLRRDVAKHPSACSWPMRKIVPLRQNLKTWSADSVPACAILRTVCTGGRRPSLARTNIQIRSEGVPARSITPHYANVLVIVRCVSIRAGLDALQQRYSNISEVRDRGCMLAIEIMEDRASKSLRRRSHSRLANSKFAIDRRE